MKNWKTLNKEDVSPSKWFPVERHEVELANGKIVDDFYISPMGEFVMILPITKQQEIIFVKQYKHGAGEIVLELPAGYLDKGKTLTEMAVIELREETGIDVNESELKPLGKFINLPTKLNNKTHAFLVEGVEITVEQDLDENEDIEVVKIPIAKALAMIVTGEINTADSIAVLYRANLMFKDLFSIE